MIRVIRRRADNPEEPAEPGHLAPQGVPMLGGLLRGTTGQTMLEFALVAPILLMVLTGIFAFGIALNQYEILTNAVSDGARAFVLSEGTVGTNGSTSMAPNQDPCAYAVSATEASGSSLAASNMTFAITYTTAAGTATSYTTSCPSLLMHSMDSVQVKVTYPVTPHMLGFGPQTLRLSAQTTEFVQ